MGPVSLGVALFFAGKASQRQQKTIDIETILVLRRK